MLVLTLNRSNRLVIDVPPSASPQRVHVQLKRSGRQKASVVISAPREIAITRAETTAATARSRNPRRLA